MAGFFMMYKQLFKSSTGMRSEWIRNSQAQYLEMKIFGCRLKNHQKTNSIK